MSTIFIRPRHESSVTESYGRNQIILIHVESQSFLPNMQNAESHSVFTSIYIYLTICFTEEFI